MGGSLGTFLQGCRKQTGFSADDLARELRISVARLHALEEDRFEGFADEAALKECLAEYAELVDLTPGAVERLYQRQAKKAASGTIFSADVASRSLKFEPPVSGPASSPALTTRPKKGRSFPWAILFVLPIIAAVAFLVWQQAQKGSTLTAPLEATPSASHEAQQLAVIPLGGGVVKLKTTKPTRLRLSIDNRGIRSYRVDGQGSLRWQVSSSAHFFFEDPTVVQLWINEVPLKNNPSFEMVLVPEATKGE